MDDLDKILKSYRSKSADAMQQYWEIIGTGKDTGITTELLNKLDAEAKSKIITWAKPKKKWWKL